MWADFSGREVGAELAMKSLPFSGSQPAMFERMMKMMGGGLGGMMGGMGMMFSMAHPIHLHGQQFQIMRRELEGG